MPVVDVCNVCGFAVLYDELHVAMRGQNEAVRCCRPGCVVLYVQRWSLHGYSYHAQSTFRSLGRNKPCC